MSDNYLVLSRKWRPQSFNDVVGQIHVTQTLQNALSQNRLGHGYLFTGSRGVGKTSVARILSRVLNCMEPKGLNPCNKCNLCIDILNGNNFDVIELDGASNRGIDEIRDLRESVKYAPASGKYKIYIIDEVHMLTKEAFNALLKTLEEPPKHVLFILATTDPHKIPQTILSRTQRFNFKRISIEDINSYLSKILKHEEKQFDEACLKLISKKADGSMRDALSLLDQVIAYCDDAINVQNVSEAIGLIDSIVYSKLLFFILKSDLSKILKTVDDSLSRGHSISDFTNGFIDYLNRCMHFYLKDNIENDIFFDDEVKSFLKKVESHLDINFIVRILDSMLQFQNKLKFVNQPMISLESQFIKLAYINKGAEYSIDENDLFEKVEKKEFVDNNINSENKPNETINSDKESTSNVTDVKDADVQNSEDLQPDIKSNDENIENHDNKSDSNIENSMNQDSQGKISESNLVTINDVQQKWTKIMELIESKNPKTSSFLDNAEIDSLDEDKLTLSIINGSQFHINSLENDINIINDSFSDLLGTAIKVCFKLKTDDNSKKNKENKPEQHPLLDKAIDLLDGEVI